MSLEKIVQTALAEQPIEMKEAFDEAMKERIALALEEKYKKEKILNLASMQIFKLKAI